MRNGTLNQPGEGRAARGALLWITAMLCSAAFAPAVSQTSPLGTEVYDTSYIEPLPDAGRRTAVPQFTFRLAKEIPLPGPLPGDGPELLGDRVRIPVAHGVAESGWTGDSEPRIGLPAEPDPESARPAYVRLDWSVAPDGLGRFAMSENGFLVAQRKCARCLTGWRQHWVLRVAGVGLAPPLVTEKRVFFGAMDNRVYCVKRKNGHRVWEIDLEARVSRPLGLWRAPADDSDPGKALTLVLVVSGGGSGMVALDSRTGAKVASYTLPDGGGMLIGAPLVTPDGRIVVARQKYTPSDASLMVFDLTQPAQPA